MSEYPEEISSEKQPSLLEQVSSLPSKAVQSIRGNSRSYALIVAGLSLAAFVSTNAAETSQPIPVVKSVPEPVEPPSDDQEFTMKGFQLRECNDKENPQIREAVFALRGAIRYFISSGNDEFVDNLIKISSSTSREEAEDLFVKLPQLLKNVDETHLEIMCGTLDSDTAAALIYENIKTTGIGIKTVPPRPESTVAEMAGLLGHEVLHKNDFFGPHGHLDFTDEDGLDLPYYFGYLVEMYVDDANPQ